MRIFVLLYMLFSFSFGFSQKTNLYVLYDEQSEVDIHGSLVETNTIAIFNFKLNKNSPHIIFSLANEGILKKEVSLEGVSYNVVSFKYDNFKNTNAPFLEKSDRIKNKISFYEMMNSDFDNLLSVLKQFDNIYIVCDSDIFNGYYLVRKVVLDQKGKL